MSEVFHFRPFKIFPLIATISDFLFPEIRKSAKYRTMIRMLDDL